MSKKLVFQINVPNHIQTSKVTAYTYHTEMYSVSERNARNYAAKCKADYYLLSNPNDYKPAAGKHLDYQKLKMYDFLNYDKIVYFDSDYIIKDNAPDLFEFCENKFHAVPDPGKTVDQLALNLGIPKDRYFNAGFMFVPKEVLLQTIDAVPKYLEKEYEFQGQGLLNKLFYDYQIDFVSLNDRDWNPVKRTFGTYADHYAGGKKSKWGMVTY